MDKNQHSQQFLSGSKYDHAEASVGFIFWKAFNAWSRSIRAEIEKLKLTQVQYSIMAATGYLGSTNREVTQQHIANQLSMDKMMVSDVVKTLENKKLLTRRRHSTDGRAFSLALTAKGQRLLNEAVPVVERADEKFFSALSEDQRRSLIKLLAQLVES